MTQNSASRRFQGLLSNHLQNFQEALLKDFRNEVRTAAEEAAIAAESLWKAKTSTLEAEIDVLKTKNTILDKRLEDAKANQIWLERQLEEVKDERDAAAAAAAAAAEAPLMSSSTPMMQDAARSFLAAQSSETPTKGTSSVCPISVQGPPDNPDSAAPEAATPSNATCSNNNTNNTTSNNNNNNSSNNNNNSSNSNSNAGLNSSLPTSISETTSAVAAATAAVAAAIGGGAASATSGSTGVGLAPSSSAGSISAGGSAPAALPSSRIPKPSASSSYMSSRLAGNNSRDSHNNNSSNNSSNLHPHSSASKKIPADGGIDEGEEPKVTPAHSSSARLPSTGPGPTRSGAEERSSTPSGIKSRRRAGDTDLSDHLGHRNLRLGAMQDKRTLRKMHRETFRPAILDWCQNHIKSPLPKSKKSQAIKVFVRLRPLFEREQQQGEFEAVTAFQERGEMVVHNCLFQADLVRMYIQHSGFWFPQSFGAGVSNEEVYAECAAPLVAHALKGQLSTIFMFGQTGSGKTFTMQSIIDQAARDIFTQPKEMAAIATEQSSSEDQQQQQQQQQQEKELATAAAAAAATTPPEAYAEAAFEEEEMPLTTTTTTITATTTMLTQVAGTENPEDGSEGCEDISAREADDTDETTGATTAATSTTTATTTATATAAAAAATAAAAAAAAGAAAIEAAGVRLRVLEIKGNKCSDLLARGRSTAADLKLLDSDDGRTNIMGAQELQLHTEEDLRRSITDAFARRATATHGRNEESSRSHCICLMELPTRGSLVLVDCAGTERRQDTDQHNAERTKESAEINSSLHALKECIRYWAKEQRQVLAQKADEERKQVHVPYRGSYLTRLLADSFTRSGSKLAAIGTVSPASLDVEHSLSTLKTLQLLTNFDSATGSDAPNFEQRVDLDSRAHQPQWSSRGKRELLDSGTRGGGNTSATTSMSQRRNM